jgi:beta-lactam-binding protein with PASTA domain
VKVPSKGVVGQSVSSARDTLMAAGFKVSIYTRRFFSNTVPADFVITTYPRPGLRAPRGGTVFLIVSEGPPAQVPTSLGP